MKEVPRPIDDSSSHEQRAKSQPKTYKRTLSVVDSLIKDLGLSDEENQAKSKTDQKPTKRHNLVEVKAKPQRKQQSASIELIDWESNGQSKIENDESME